MAGRLHTNINSVCNISLHMDNKENLDISQWPTMLSDAFSATLRTPFTSARPLFRAFLTTQLCDVFLESPERVLIASGTTSASSVPHRPSSPARIAPHLGLDAPAASYASPQSPQSIPAHSTPTRRATRRSTPAASPPVPLLPQLLPHHARRRERLRRRAPRLSSLRPCRAASTKPHAKGLRGVLPALVRAALLPPRQRPVRSLAKTGTRFHQKLPNTPAQHPTPAAESRTPKTSYQPPTTTAGSFRRRVLISVTQRTTDHDMLAVGNACDARYRYDALRCARNTRAASNTLCSHDHDPRAASLNSLGVRSRNVRCVRRRPGHKRHPRCR